MNSALIGHTGFVGGNLLRQFPFTDLYNSANIEAIAGRTYDLLVCAGAPGVKWKANKEPARDWASLTRLMNCLAQVQAEHLVLISTVDVYPVPVAVDEDSPIDAQANSPYGRHRLQLERFVQQRFATTVLRLPGLFGHGLKKNVIYDFLHHNALDAICPASVYQFYHLEQLWQDIARVRQQQIPLLNVATAGVSVQEIAQVAFGMDFVNPQQTNAARYDFKSKYAERLGGADGYLYSKAAVLAAIKGYVAEEQKVLA
jgi:nucleoside-diphosphate-sugar epimerase